MLRKKEAKLIAKIFNLPQDAVFILFDFLVSRRYLTCKEQKYKLTQAGRAAIHGPVPGDFGRQLVYYYLHSSLLDHPQKISNPDAS